MPGYPRRKAYGSGNIFLKRVNLGQRDLIGNKVIIIGGGGVAFDCAFTAKRLGAAEVHIVGVEGQECMCAPAHEISQVETDGIVVAAGSPVRAERYFMIFH